MNISFINSPCRLKYDLNMTHIHLALTHNSNMIQTRLPPLNASNNLIYKIFKFKIFYFAIIDNT